MAKITKVVIAAAGYGTRFLPATKVIPKELLPLVDRPIIQYLVEEAVASGIEEVILVTRPNTPLIYEHFSPKVAVEEHLVKNGKVELLESLKKISNMAKFTFVEQDPSLPYGTGAPLASIERLISEGEHFVLMFGDDLFRASRPATSQLLERFGQREAVYLGCQEVEPSVVNRYGIIKFKEGSTEEMADMVEKPPVGEAPSNLASFGRFILNREILDILLQTKDNIGEGREFYLTDALSTYAAQKSALAVKLEGKWLTTGDPLNWLKANIEYAKDIPEFREYLRSLKI